MAFEIISAHAPHLIDNILSWQGAVAVVAVGVVGYTYVLSGLRSPGRSSGMLGLTAGSVKKAEVARVMDGYDKSYEKEGNGALTLHHLDKKESVAVVDTFYNLVTDGYELTWDTSFHFSPRPRFTNFRTSQILHEARIGYMARIQPGFKVLDVGCGVGNPGRTIAALTGAHVTGITINEYQVQRALIHTKRAGLMDLFTPVKGDFTEMPFEDNSFDAAFAIEATCHAPKLDQVYAEVFRVLKPGAYFAVYEAVTTSKYDPTNKRHVEMINSLIYGNGIPDMRTWKEAEESGKRVGFTLCCAYDAGAASPVSHPWYERPRDMLKYGVVTFTKVSIKILDSIGILPRDFSKVCNCVGDSVPDLVESGETGIFTPMYLYVWQKPETATAVAKEK